MWGESVSGRQDAVFPAEGTHIKQPLKVVSSRRRSFFAEGTSDSWWQEGSVRWHGGRQDEVFVRRGDPRQAAVAGTGRVACQVTPKHLRGVWTFGASEAMGFQ